MKDLGDIAREAAQVAGLLTFLGFVSFAIEGELARWGSHGAFVILVKAYALFFAIYFVFAVFYRRRR